MSDSEDNWFDKDIDEFVVETKLAENVEDITLEEKRSQFNDLASAGKFFFCSTHQFVSSLVIAYILFS